MIKLFNLGYVSWLDSQLLYHAEPRAGVECLNILAPREPYVCIGCHQDVVQEVDLQACAELNIPVFRREVGGGAVYLDGRQIFFHLTLRKDNPLSAGDKETFYRRLLQPVADTYCDLGVPSRYKPVNDIITEAGRKISGTGVAEIGDYVVLVGNLIADFDYDTMVRILRVPDEKYRDKIHTTMRENLTTLKRETGKDYSVEELAAPLIHRFEEVLGPLEEAVVPGEVRMIADELQPVMTADEWLYKKGKKFREERNLRISGDVRVLQKVHKAPGGLIRALLELKDGSYRSVSLSGDFFCYPREAVGQLEKMLSGVPVTEAEQVVTRFYATGVDTPGVSISDWRSVLSPD